MDREMVTFALPCSRQADLHQGEPVDLQLEVSNEVLIQLNKLGSLREVSLPDEILNLLGELVPQPSTKEEKRKRKKKEQKEQRDFTLRSHLEVQEDDRGHTFCHTDPRRWHNSAPLRWQTGSAAGSRTQ